MSTPHADIPQPTARLVAGPGVFIVLSGPSGVGKDTLLQRLFERDSLLHYSVSYTTRPPREGEVDGVSYVFVSEQTFWELALRGELLEWGSAFLTNMPRYFVMPSRNFPSSPTTWRMAMPFFWQSARSASP